MGFRDDGRASSSGAPWKLSSRQLVDFKHSSLNSYRVESSLRMMLCLCCSLCRRLGQIRCRYWPAAAPSTAEQLFRHIRGGQPDDHASSWLAVVGRGSKKNIRDGLCRMGFQAPLQKVEHPCRFLAIFTNLFRFARHDSPVLQVSCLRRFTAPKVLSLLVK